MPLPKNVKYGLLFVALVVITLLLFYNYKSILPNLTSSDEKSKLELTHDDGFLRLNKWIYLLSKNKKRVNESTDLKKTFENIYAEQRWGNKGKGSGYGSTIEYTLPTRNTLYEVVSQYKLKSLLDASCGGFLWMPLFLRNISTICPDFKYKGLDAVYFLINGHKEAYANETNWSFENSDFTIDLLPPNFDLVLIRDTLQHLSYSKVMDALENVASTPGIKFLLVTSVPTAINKRNIRVGGSHDVNLESWPFNLKPIKTFVEGGDRKHLLLFDIPNYLSSVNFEIMHRSLRLIIQ